MSHSRLTPAISGPAGVSVLHRDDRILVLDKPSGLLSVPGLGPANADSLAGRAEEAYPGARTVHRLDRDTSGVIVMAFDADAHRELGRQFERRQVAKGYVAVVAGPVTEDAGEIILPIRTDIENRPHQIVDPVHGKPALTRYRVLSRGARTSRLDLRPLTGRSHQLRVHLKEIGHAVLGDDLYAPPDARAMSDRLMLHAEWLRFRHPGNGRVVTFVVPGEV
jgi:tRNA pseudouridine32 synthase/23S rRNA pseudouridine746 synthase